MPSVILSKSIAAKEKDLSMAHFCFSKKQRDNSPVLNGVAAKAKDPNQINKSFIIDGLWPK